MKLLILLFTLLTSGFCWGQTGHKIIAYVANKLLSKTSKDNMQPLLNGEDLVFYAPLPDSFDHCEGGEWNKPYHYIDVDGPSFVPDRDCKGRVCVYGSVLNYTDRLTKYDKPCVASKEPTPGNNPEPCNLEFLTHFSGDIHCPVHVTNSELFPEGGNQLFVKVMFMEYNETDPSIHKVWDSVIIDHYVDITYGAYNWEKWADDMIIELSKNSFSLLHMYQKEKDPLEWAYEVNHYSNTIVNDFDRDTAILNTTYFENGVRLCNEMLEKSSARLLMLLEQDLH